MLSYFCAGICLGDVPKKANLFTHPLPKAFIMQTCCMINALRPMSVMTPEDTKLIGHDMLFIGNASTLRFDLSFTI